MPLLLPSWVPIVIGLSSDVVMLILALIEEGGRYGWAAFDLVGAFNHSSWQNFTSWVISMLVPWVWIILYYVTVSEWLIPEVTKGACRRYNEDDERVEFVNQMGLFGGPVAGWNWPFTLPTVFVAVVAYWLPLFYMVFLNAYHALAMLFHSSFPTDSVATTQGRVFGPTPDVVVEGSESSWEKKWKKAHTRLVSKYKAPDEYIAEGETEKTEENPGFMAFYNPPSSLLYRKHQLDGKSRKLVESGVNRCAQDLPSAFLAMLLVSQAGLVYSGGDTSTNVTSAIINYGFTLIPMLFYAFTHPGQTVSTILVAVIISSIYFGLSELGAATPFWPDAGCCKVDKLGEDGRALTPHAYWTDDYSQMRNVNDDQFKALLEEAEKDPYCGAVR